MARSYMSGIECGLRNSTFTMLMRILEGLEMQPTEFFQRFRFRQPRAPRVDHAGSLEGDEGTCPG